MARIVGATDDLVAVGAERFPNVADAVYDSLVVAQILAMTETFCTPVAPVGFLLQCVFSTNEDVARTKTTREFE